MKLIKKDYSGKILFLVGVILIGTSIFNLFEDPIVNQYYRLKRNFDRQNNQTIVINTVGPSEVVDTDMPPESTPLNLYDELPDLVDLDESGFLPLSVEVREDNEVTPEPTKESDVLPVRLVIPSIDLDADIINAQQKELVQADKTYIQWLAPDEYAVGWHFDSAF